MSYQESNGSRRVWIDHVSELGAGAETVATLLRDIDGWPTWTPGLRAIRRKAGPLQVGTSFVMMLKMGSLPTTPLPCKVFRLEPNFIEWGGGFAGGFIRHSFAIEAIAPGRCRLRHVEYATGWLGLLTRPVEKIAYRHDKGWSVEIERRFPLAIHSVS